MNDSKALFTLGHLEGLIAMDAISGELVTGDEAGALDHAINAVKPLAAVRSIIASPNLTALESYSQIVDLVKV